MTKWMRQWPWLTNKHFEYKHMIRSGEKGSPLVRPSELLGQMRSFISAICSSPVTLTAGQKRDYHGNAKFNQEYEPPHPDAAWTRKGKGDRKGGRTGGGSKGKEKGGKGMTASQRRAAAAIARSLRNICRWFNYSWAKCGRSNCQFPHRCAGCNIEKITVYDCICDEGKAMRLR